MVNVEEKLQLMQTQIDDLYSVIDRLVPALESIAETVAVFDVLIRQHLENNNIDDSQERIIWEDPSGMKQ